MKEYMSESQVVSSLLYSHQLGNLENLCLEPDPCLILSSPLPTPRPGNMVGRPGVLCPGLSLCLAQSSPHISKSYFLLPASFSQMLISPKTYSDHPLNILTLDFHSFISSATL